MPVQDNEDKRTVSEPAANAEELRKKQAVQQEHGNSVQKSGKLIPFLNAKVEFHQSRINSIDGKIARQQDKITKHEGKIAKLSEKADRLEDTNRMLKATLGGIPVVRKMIEANENRIAAIRTEKIPNRRQKFLKCKSKMNTLSAKRERISHKLSRVLALNDMIKSFSIRFNKERREVFADAMSRLNEAALDCLIDKKASLVSQKQELIQAYTATETSAVDKYRMQEKINTLNDRISAVDSKIDKLGRPDEHYAEQTNDQLDAGMKLTADKLTEMTDSGNISTSELAENTLSSAHKIEEMEHSEVATLADQFNSEPFSEAEELTANNEITEDNWLADMVNDGKAAFTEDGGFKINPEYYKELSRNDRHIESMTEAQAVTVMSALSAAGVIFSAASRGDDKVGITVSKKDVPVLNDIMQKSIGRFVQRSSEKSQDKDEHYQTINPDYYKSLPKDLRHTRVETKDTAREIIRGLQKENIPYSAVIRKNDTVAVTVEKSDVQAYQQIENAVKGERATQFVNPEFFKSLPKQERFTRRMPEAQVRAKISELQADGIEHSAIIDGEKSAVTVAKKDTKKAFFSRSMMHKEAQRVKQQGKPSTGKTQPTKKKNSQGLD